VSSASFLSCCRDKPFNAAIIPFYVVRRSASAVCTVADTEMPTPVKPTASSALFMVHGDIATPLVEHVQVLGRVHLVVDAIDGVAAAHAARDRASPCEPRNLPTCHP
jgi:hypothetical protein